MSKLKKGLTFLQGDIAVAEGALRAGCKFFAGYPITPATEVAEHMSLMLPYYDGNYIQMEDEIASMGACIGASYAGTKSMTATSGPGLSLMMENVGLAVMTETPLVIVDIMRVKRLGLRPENLTADLFYYRIGDECNLDVLV